LFHTSATSAKVDQVKFVKPVVAKAAEVTEEPPKIVEIKEKN
jgi:protein TonB